jgi:hypothetical protein
MGEDTINRVTKCGIHKLLPRYLAHTTILLRSKTTVYSEPFAFSSDIQKYKNYNVYKL